jgi:broad specificity phosphatase PhoE
MRYLLPVLVLLAVSCTSQRYYVIRHAEKAIVTKDSLGFTASNPPLSDPGQVRAFVVRDELKNKHISTIFSTNYHRTIATAKPLATARSNMSIQNYSPSKDSLNAFIERLKAIKKGSVLVVGHSNTVDDIVNSLTGEKNIPGDLKDSEYDNMYIIRRKKDKMEFTQRKYGYPSNPEK